MKLARTLFFCLVYLTAPFVGALTTGCQQPVAAAEPCPAPERCPGCETCIVSQSQVTGTEGSLYLYLRTNQGASLTGIMTSPEKCTIVAKYMNSHIEEGMLFGCWNTNEVLKGLPE